MKLQTIPYTDYKIDLPRIGQHIVGQVQNGNIVVYQAFNPAIAAYAVIAIQNEEIVRKLKIDKV